jgi:hypothetical protein
MLANHVASLFPIYFQTGAGAGNLDNRAGA